MLIRSYDLSPIADVITAWLSNNRTMEVPPSVKFLKELHLFVWKPRGILDEAAVNKVLVDLLRHECRASQPFNRFSDLSEVQDFHLTFKYVFHIALHRRLAYAGREQIKSVFFVTRPEAAQLVKMHAVITDHSPLKVEMFDDRAAAARSLGVPVEALVMREPC